MAKNTKWEYLAYSDGTDLAKLNQLGNDRWEMVAFVYNPCPTPVPGGDPPSPYLAPTFVFYFKREL
jgi:hypothetical protein